MRWPEGVLQVEDGDLRRPLQGRLDGDGGGGSAAAQEDDPFLQEFWRCAMSLRRDQQEMLLRLMREMGGQR